MSVTLRELREELAGTQSNMEGAALAGLSLTEAIQVLKDQNALAIAEMQEKVVAFAYSS